MAAPAGSEVVAAKSFLSIMTGRATLAPAGSMMIERLRLGGLLSLRQAGADLMASCARGLLVLRMAKADQERTRSLRRARVTAELVTRATRGYVATV